MGVETLEGRLATGSLLNPLLGNVALTLGMEEWEGITQTARRNSDGNAKSICLAPQSVCTGILHKLSG